jgi:hypothetical protein
MSNDQELVIKISAKNLTADEFAKARKEIANLNEETKNQNKALKENEKYWEDVGRQIGDVMVTAGKAGAIVGAAIGAIAVAVVELGKHGADVNDIRDQFDKLNGAMGLDSKQSIATLSTAVDGVVSKFDLMKITNKALSGGLQATNSDFKVMGEGARVLADRIGGDTKEAYESITEALTSGKTARLNQIGLNIDETATLKAHADALGKDVADLNEHEKKVALQTAVMKELSSAIETSGRSTIDFGDRVDIMKASLADAYDEFSSGIANSKVLGAALEAAGEIVQQVFGGDNQDLIKTIIHYIEFAALTMVEWARTGLTAGDLIARVFSGTQVVFDAVGAAVARVGEYFFRLVKGLDTVGSYIPGIGSQFAEAGAHAGELADYLGGVADGFEEAGGKALQSAVGQRDSNDMFVRLDKTLVGVRDKMADAMAATDEDTKATDTNTNTRKRQNETTTQSNKLLEKYTKKLRELTSGLKSADAMGAPIDFVKQKFGSTIAEIIADAQILGTAVPAIVRDAFLKISLKGADEQMAKELENVQKVLAEQAKKGFEKNSADYLTNLNAQSAAYKTALDMRNKMTMNSYDYEKSVIQRNAADKKSALKDTGEGYADAMAAIDQETDAAMTQAAMTWKDKTEEMQASTNSLQNLTNKWLSNLPSLITSAFTGGGGLGGAIKGLLGQAGGDIGGKLFEAGGLMNGVGNKLAGVFGAGLGAALPGIGQAIGSMIGPLVGKLAGMIKSAFGGPSADELAGRSKVADFEKQLQSTLSATQRASAGNESWKMTTIAVRDAYIATGRSEAEAEAAVKNLWASSQQGAAASAAAIEALNGVLNEQKQDQADLKAAVEEYGFTIEELGPKMQKQQLTDQAVKLENQYRLLVQSGIDVGTVVEHMSDKMNDYLQTSIKTGQSVPSEMRPMIEKMIEMGKLTDENGNKIESLDGSGITFSETMTQGFDRIVKALKEVTGALTGVKTGIDDLPDKKEITVHTNYTNTHHGGDGDEPSFATEAYVRSPTLAMIGDVPGGEFRA